MIVDEESRIYKYLAGINLFSSFCLCLYLCHVSIFLSVSISLFLSLFISIDTSLHLPSSLSL